MLASNRINESCRMTIIIGLVSQKGGVCKSTLSRGLAREFAARELTVLIADLDTQQATTAHWADKRNAQDIEPKIEVKEKDTVAAALEEAPNYDVLILDGPARTSAGTLEIARAAHLIIQPANPSRDDLDPAVKAFHELTANDIDPKRLLLVIVLTHADTEFQQAKTFLEKTPYSCLPVDLPSKISYRHAQNAGYAITETAYDSLNERAQQLFDAIGDKLQTVIR